MEKPLVLITNRFHPDAMLRGKSHDEILFENYDHWKLGQPDFQSVKGLIVRSGTKVHRRWLEKFPQLQVVQTATSGFDHLDLELCRERKIKVSHVPEAPVTAVAELTFLLILSGLRKQRQIFNQLKKGDWDRTTLMGRQLQGRLLGLIGCGRIGSKVASMAQGWGMKVATFDPYVDQVPTGVQRLGYEELLRTCDILSFHVPKTSKTHYMLNASTLEMVSSEAIVVNTSRGSVINEVDFVGFLRENPEAIGALDVFESEPLARESPLYSLSNMTLSPHIGATTEECLLASSLKALHNMECFFAHGHIPDELPPKALWWQDVQPNRL